MSGEVSIPTPIANNMLPLQSVAGLISVQAGKEASGAQILKLGRHFAVKISQIIRSCSDIPSPSRRHAYLRVTRINE